MASALLAIAGLLVRLSPLWHAPDRLFWQFMSEDGYLMQTVARNMALGLGMSTAAGTMPTNGVQPLATFVFAGLHALVGGDRVGAISLVTLWSALVALAAAALLRGVLIRLLPPDANGARLATLGASAWFASPLITVHSMNGLETGLYHLSLIGTLWVYLRWTAVEALPWSMWRRVGLGALLGVCFLARNDAVFFIAALLLSHVVLGHATAGGARLHRVWDAVVAGLVSLVVALPWLVHNQVRFGSIVPMSGKAESHTAAFAENLHLIPANLLEATTLLLRVPRSLEGHPAVAWGAALVWTVIAGLIVARVARRDLASRRMVATAMLFTAGIAGYYGLLFGAPWFVTRYVSALSPLWWPLTLTAGCLFVAHRRSAAGRLAGHAILGLGLLVVVGMDLRSFVNGQQHQHRQVVDWVAGHVPEATWVGAVQTGTLGYFHDRTINLDGKVNPAALAAVLRQHQVQSYVLDETPVQYIVDWVGVAGWLDDPREPRFRREFSLIVKSDLSNLAVLQRTAPRDAP